MYESNTGDSRCFHTYVGQGVNSRQAQASNKVSLPWIDWGGAGWVDCLVIHYIYVYGLGKDCFGKQDGKAVNAWACWLLLLKATSIILSPAFNNNKGWDGGGWFCFQPHTRNKSAENKTKAWAYIGKLFISFNFHFFASAFGTEGKWKSNWAVTGQPALQFRGIYITSDKKRMLFLPRPNEMRPKAWMTRGYSPK